jgi:hypothetical protein
MKHVTDYYSFITEGKKQYTYTVKVQKEFNIFNLYNDLKPLGAEVLNNEPNGKSKDEYILTIAMNDSKKEKIEKTIEKHAELLEAK